MFQSEFEQRDKNHLCNRVARCFCLSMSAVEIEQDPPSPKASHEALLNMRYETPREELKVLDSQDFVEARARHEEAEKSTEKVKRIQELNAADFPGSYSTNTPKEELIAQYVQTFREQFESLYPHRRPLFLLPKNECGIPVRFPTDSDAHVVEICVFNSSSNPIAL